MNYLMLIAIVAMLMMLWVLGLATSFTIDGFIHLLPAVAGILILGKYLWARKAGSLQEIDQVFRSKSNHDSK